MTDTVGRREKTTKEKETDYYNLTFFVHGLKRTQDFDVCLDEYLKIYSAHMPMDRRSKFIFTILMTSRLNATAPDDKYLGTLTAELAGGKQVPSPRKQRVDTLEEAQKHEILSIIKSKLDTMKEKETILDELKNAYANENPKKEPTLEQLYAFDPLPDPQLWAAFNRVKARSDKAWSACEAPMGLNDDTWSELSASFTAILKFLKDSGKDELKLFQILKWCRDPVMSGGTLNRQYEFYLQTVNAILLRAIQVKNLKANYYGFTPAEDKFFFGPLRTERNTYYSNQANRFRYALSDVQKFTDLSVWHMRLLLFATSRSMNLVSDEHSITILKTLEKTPKEHLQSKRFSTEGFTNLLPVLGVFKVGVKIGEGPTEFTIVYFEKEERTATILIYVEFARIPNYLFQMNIHTFVSRLEAVPRLIVWQNTQSLLVLIPAYFQLLAELFMPGGGYVNIFLESGFKGVVKQVLISELTDVMTEGGGKQEGWSLAANAAALVASRRSIVDKARAVENKLGKLAEQQVAHEEEIQAAGLAQEKPSVATREGTFKPAVRFDKPPANENAPIRLPAERPVGPTASSGVQEVSIVAANQNVSSEEQQILGEIAAFENEEARQLEVRMAAGGSGRGAATRPSIGTRSVSGANRSVPAPPSTPVGAKSLQGKKIALDPNLATQVGIPQTQRKFVVRNAEIFKEEWEARRNIIDPRTRSTQAHKATQRRIKEKYARAVTEEPTGITGPAIPRSDVHLRSSDVAWSSRQGVVVELKAKAFLTENKALAVSGYDVGRAVESDQIQCYEILYNELDRPVVVIAGNGRIFAPSSAGGWMLIGGPGF
jgi:hypothetical protein